ncbi:hypothetical protein FA95DRAFT_91143 [Auriscalpium vulgare]|uniref:Uncharacterized protein n=1 Tax=Auriscalpium vulgare TaxID=40419 RepID=A0ACB8RNH3_9AGAM|nr:hypothetical protein FA95DRAFT_91143 [Auriscalpium vulgare]
MRTLPGTSSVLILRQFLILSGFLIVDHKRRLDMTKVDNVEGQSNMDRAVSVRAYNELTQIFHRLICILGFEFYSDFAIPSPTPNLKTLYYLRVPYFLASFFAAAHVILHIGTWIFGIPQTAGTAPVGPRVRRMCFMHIYISPANMAPGPCAPSNHRP